MSTNVDKELEIKFKESQQRFQKFAIMRKLILTVALKKKIQSVNKSKSMLAKYKKKFEQYRSKP